MRKPIVLANPKLAIAYLRVSTEDQKLGPDAQRVAIDQWASRQGISVVAWHLDQGVSGGTPVDKRPALLSALADLKEHHAGVLVLAKRDRLARDVVIAAVAERMVIAAGARVMTADGVSAEDTPEAQLMRTMLDAFSQYERALIRARTKSALRLKKTRGERTGSVPFGFRLADDGVHLAINEQEQRTVERIKELARLGLTQREIASQLACEGHASREGTPLQQVQVHRLLRRVAA